jgi:translation initiation factor 2 beta subunit (eIF-2beta)/eIF-5
MAADPEIQGHPELELPGGTLITVCANCGQMRTILFLARDRWFCFKCKTEGAAPPNLYPVA